MKPDPIRFFLPPIASGRNLLIGAKPPPRTSSAPAGPSRRQATGAILWSAYWQEFHIENEPHERCHVPGDGKATVDAHWSHFADQLKGGEQVIDLGCGAGVVGRTLLSRRNNLHITGIDWANVPITSVANLKIYPRVSMEDLPFADRNFDAAVSLFGIEYGNTERTARELHRVLKPGARFSFVVHHRESEISREGNARRRVLRELTSGKMKTAYLTGNVSSVSLSRQGLRRQFPDEPMIDLVGNYFIRNITKTRADRQATWQKLADDLEPEITLLGHLDKAAKSPVEMASWLAALLSAMTVVRVSVLRRPSGEPIAWNVSGRR